MPKTRKKPQDPFIVLSGWVRVVLVIIAVELLLLNGLFLAYLIGAKEMGETTTEMLELSRSMNASTSTSMGKVNDLLQGVTPEDVAQIVADAKRAVGGAGDIMGSVAESGNLTALAVGVRRVVMSINVTAVAGVVKDASIIMHAAESGISTINVKAIAQRISDIAMTLDPGVLHTTLFDVRNITGETRRIVDGLAVTHRIGLTW